MPYNGAGTPMKTSKFVTSNPNPLSRSQLEECKKTARRLPTHREADFLFDVVPFTGLIQNEFIHLKKSWITWPDETHSDNINSPIITIPKTDTCGYTRWAECPPEVVSKDGPCYECRTWGETNKWAATDQSKVRQIPVHEPVAQKALHRYFITFGFDVNPWGPDHQKNIIRRVNSESSLSRSVTYLDLIHTFIHICAENGINREHIIDISPYSGVTRSVKRIIADSSTGYNIQFEPGDYLMFIAQEEPVTCKELSEATGKSYNVSRRAINNLNKEGLIEETGKRYRQYGTDVAEYSITQRAERNQGIMCDLCGRAFGSFRGREKHKKIVHGNESLPGKHTYGTN